MEKFRLPIVVIGKERVGKTSICVRFCKGTFNPDYLSTLGSQIFEKKLVVEDTEYDLVTWDLGGQDQFTNECAMYVKQAYVIVLAFAVDEVSSFIDLKKWAEFIVERAGMNPDVLLVATKVDLRDGSGGCISTDQVKNAMEKYGFDAMLETSAKTGHNISKLFKTCAELCHARKRTAYEPISMKEVL